MSAPHHGQPDQARLQRRYEALLRVYPARYRAEHGGELLGTLLETSRADQAFPSAREAIALVRAGVRARMVDAARPADHHWLDGLHLGIFLLALSQLLVPASGDFAVFSTGWLALLAVTVALFRGWLVVAVPVAIALAFSVSWPLLYDYLPDEVNTWQRVTPGYGNWYAIAPYVIVAAGGVALAVASLPFRRRLEPSQPARRRFTVRPAVLRARSWGWLLIPGAVLALYLVGLSDPWQTSWRLAILAIEVGVLTVAVGVSRIAQDPRWTVAATVFFAPGMVYLLEEGARTAPELIYLTMVWGLILAGAVTVATPRPRPGVS